MKNLLVFAALISACCAQTASQRKEWTEQCAEEAGADLGDLLGMERLMEFMKTREYKCLTKCYSIKTGLFNEKGEWNMERLESMKNNFPVAIRDPAKLAEAAIRCAAEHKHEDLCQQVTATANCLHGL